MLRHVSDMLATCQLKHYHTQFQEVVIRSIPISDAVASVNGRVVPGERHGMCESVFKTAGEWHGVCESVFKTAGERHGMCESALDGTCCDFFFCRHD
jgi:hypothetical protein